MEANKARNMLEHEKEIFSRPPRTWIKPTSLKRPTSLSDVPSDHQLPKNKKAKKPAKQEDVRNYSCFEGVLSVSL